MANNKLLKSSIFDYKSEVIKEPQIVNIDDIDEKLSGRFDVKFKDINFECFLKRSEAKRLFVFFSSAGRGKNNRTTVFHRISWCNKLNGICLYIEDPMYKQNSELKSGWYYGREDVSYLIYVVDIIKKISAINNIENKNIYMVGSSSGGYAALYCSNLVSGSLAYAYNPPIMLNKSVNAINFYKVTKIELEELDPFNRNDLKYIQNNNISNFFIFFNMASQRDRIQCESWFKELNIEISEGLHIYNNIHFFLKNIKNSETHACVGNIDDFISTISLKNMRDSDKYDLAASNLNRFKNYILIEENNYYLKNWLKFINKFKIPDSLILIDDFNGNHLDFLVRGYKELFKYRIQLNKLKKVGTFNLYINRNKVTVSSGFLNNLEKLCKNSNIKIIIDNKSELIRLYINFNNIEIMEEGFLDFFNKTYTKLIFNYIYWGAKMKLITIGDNILNSFKVNKIVQK